ncbi:hypothetical protein [Actimicrobium antarcticum]|uniref:Tyr recombinase domain-containing protein n=1 Tax=Actimicrobium antarcticum TaxID=1051899 RepID=A0ABP7TE45_9BURK
MLSSGENPLYVAEQMGHADWSMLISVYSRWMPSVDNLAGQRVADANSKVWDSLDLLMASKRTADESCMSDVDDTDDDLDEDAFEM